MCVQNPIVAQIFGCEFASPHRDIFEIQATAPRRHWGEKRNCFLVRVAAPSHDPASCHGEASIGRILPLGTYGKCGRIASYNTFISNLAASASSTSANSLRNKLIFMLCVDLAPRGAVMTLAVAAHNSAGR